MIKIKNRPLHDAEKNKLNPLERKVVDTYEKYTNQQFMRFDLITLKELIKVATPEQINQVIIRFAKNPKTKNNFAYFSYIEKPVRNFFANKRGGSQK